MYKACPGKDGAECKKKLIDEGNGSFRCEKCNFNTPDYIYRMICNAQVSHKKKEFLRVKKSFVKNGLKNA